MSEYVTVEAEPTADDRVMHLYVNQLLTSEDEESYPSPEDGEEGAALAQALFIGVDGLRALTIEPDRLIVEREPGVQWEIMIDEVRDVLRDFFL